MNFSTSNVLGIPFVKATMQEVVAQLIADHQAGLNRFIVTANPEIVLAARKDPAYMQVLQTADYVTADGIGIVKGAALLGNPVPERVTGFDLMRTLLQHADLHHDRVFFLGAKPAVLRQTLAAVRKQYPGVVIAGSHDGYFAPDEAAEVAAQIKAARPAFVFVALGFPKQEMFIHQFRDQTPALWMGVGGSFDVLAGVAQRAPQSWQEHHVEWLYRLLQNPRRVGRMMALPHYLALILWHKFTNKQN